MDSANTETTPKETEVSTPMEVDTNELNNAPNEGAPEGVEKPTADNKYVKELRAEAKKWRLLAKDRDAIAERLHVELVRATGRLADPTDLAFDSAYLDDADALNAAIDGLLESKPHLASRPPNPSPGQGVNNNNDQVNLLGLMKNRI